MKHVTFGLGLTAIFWVFMTLAPSGSTGARSGGLKVAANFFDWLLVEPMTMPGALVFVFAVISFFSFVLYPGEKSDYEIAERMGRSATAGAGTVAGVMSQHSPTERAGFGRRVVSAGSGQTGGGRVVDLAIEKRALSENGLDWYFAHHGFEGRWRQVVRQLKASGEVELAQALTEAGEIYDRWEALRTSLDDGELTQAETNAYFAELAPWDERVRKLLKR